VVGFWIVGGIAASLTIIIVAGWRWTRRNERELASRRPVPAELPLVAGREEPADHLALDAGGEGAGSD
jgi:hypothetical protein